MNKKSVNLTSWYQRERTVTPFVINKVPLFLRKPRKRHLVGIMVNYMNGVYTVRSFIMWRVHYRVCPFKEISGLFSIFGEFGKNGNLQLFCYSNKKKNEVLNKNYFSENFRLHHFRSVGYRKLANIQKSKQICMPFVHKIKQIVSFANFWVI